VKMIVGAVLLTLVPVVGDVDTVAPPHAVTLSLQRVASESLEGRAGNQRLQTLAQKLAADLAAKQKDLQAQTTVTGEEKQAQLQRMAQQSQADFLSAQRQAQADLRGRLNPIVAELAAQHGVDFVLNSDAAVVWSAPRLDITAEVLSRLNGAAPATPVK
jgi:Skp family chaperone for outer membrane proteins